MLDKHPAALAPQIESIVCRDGYRTFARVWRVPEPIARVVCLHGIISHGGWYLRSCQRLAEAGFEVHFVDRRGSGLNAQGRGSVEDFMIWIDDVERYLERLGSDLPRVLMGISWGGKLAAAIGRHRPELASALGLICPGIYAQRGARKIQKRLLPLGARTPIQKRRVTIPLEDPALFTNVYPWQRYIAQDPLVLRQVTIRSAAEDLKLTEYAAESAEYLRVPTLVMLAGRDRIIDNPRVRDFYRRIPAVDKQLLEYPEAAHTFEFEADPEPYFADLVSWVRKVSTY